MVEAGLRKDRNQFAFFKRQAVNLPRSILERFDGSNLKEKRAFLNEVVSRTNSGDWAIATDGEIFKAWLRDGSPLGLISKVGVTAAKAWGGWCHLKEARKRGDVWVVRRNGVKLFRWREFFQPDRRGEVNEVPYLKLGLRESTHRINTGFSNWGCHLELTENEVQEWEGETARIPPNVLDKLSKVEMASERAHRQAKEHYRRISVLAETDPLANQIARELKLDFEAPPT